MTFYHGVGGSLLAKLGTLRKSPHIHTFPQYEKPHPCIIMCSY